MSLRRRQMGFTLVEVVVAFLVFALTAPAVYEVLFGALRRSLQSADEIQAWLIAQSVHDEQVSRPAPWPEQRDGELPGGWAWRIRAEPNEAGEFERAGLIAYNLTVEVRHGSDRRTHAVLRSVELSRRSP